MVALLARVSAKCSSCVVSVLAGRCVHIAAAAAHGLASKCLDLVRLHHDGACYAAAG